MTKHAEIFQSFIFQPLFREDSHFVFFAFAGQLLTSSAVHKWGTEIHEGIYNMLMLLVELVAERVKQDPVPVNLMGVLTMVRSFLLVIVDNPFFFSD